jgi:hypothetical protein
MNDKFKMSMMGKLQFFLGFDIIFGSTNKAFLFIL